MTALAKRLLAQKSKLSKRIKILNEAVHFYIIIMNLEKA